jgi:hypothetical protein
MKTSELTGRALDWAVIKAIYPGAENTSFWLDFVRTNSHSTDWLLSGPIIERERITPHAHDNGDWVAQVRGYDSEESGPTPLIAAMRCYVASKLGEEVEVPDELA